MNLYVTTAELKTYMGISSTTHDALLAMLNKQATAIVNGIVGVSDLSLHKVTEEVHHAQGTAYYLREKHAVAIGAIMDDDTEYTQDDPYDLEADTLYLTEYAIQGYRKLKIDYAAGWNAYAMATLTVTDYANIAAAATITLGSVETDGATLTRGTDWTAAASNDAEATAIATAINNKQGVKAFALKNVVYVIEDTNPQTATRTIATSDSTRLALSASTLGSVDFPEDIRLAVMTLVSSLFSSRKDARIKSYTIGSKSVTFQSDSEFQMFRDLLKPYVKVSIKAI